MADVKSGAAADESSQPTVVGIGASAGGLSALRKLFAHLPPDSGLIFVVVVHLSPEHKSLLADLLQPSVKFPVQQVTETIALERNNVYVIPPNANLSAIDTHLRLTKLEDRRRERAPIDHFFRTLASTHDGHSIGVVLTGTGSDGTLGLREIKANGGVILVQDPNEAEFDGMPQSAIATGIVDRVLTLEEIAATLVRLAQMGRSATPEKPASIEPPERPLLPKVLALLKARTDRDFTRYKPATILRRIARRMQLNYIEDFALYIDFLRDQPDEARALGDDLLITVTSFFRDPEVFEKLEKEIVPKLFAEKNGGDILRVWSVGCATGEEAYSVAMLLLEEASRRADPPRLQIFASDLHKRSLDGAREGLYPGDIESDVSPERLERFFRRENGGYRICKEVREIVVFAPHNLLGDPPFSRLNLITCRNLLIYLDRPVQRDVIDLFHYALLPHGYLLLGSAETTDASELFRTEDKKLCIYEKRNVPAPETRLPVFPLARLRTAGELYSKPEVLAAAVPYIAVHQNLLERFAPPSILVSPDNRLVHLSEHAGRYLVHPGGEVTSNVLRLVREELRGELQSLLQLTRDTRTPADSSAIAVRLNGHKAPVVMHVRPAPEVEQEGFALVIFNERQPLAEHENGSGYLSGVVVGNASEQRITELETELNVARQRLQTIIEEYETSQEEMKAANEEMQSTNEELRSTLEELETSKEELQSINEELQTVNQENRHKVEELSQLSSDLQNLLSATGIATLFLDRELRIMRFTPRVAEIFNVRVTDRGRPFSDLTNRLGHNQLRQEAQSVLDHLVPVEQEIQDDAGRWFLTRILPYRSADDRIEGVVISLIDITARKDIETALQKSESKYRGIFEAIDEGFCIVEVLFDAQGNAFDYRFLEMNPAFVKQTGLANAQGKTIRELAPGHEAFWFEVYGEIAMNGEPKRFEHQAEALDRWYDVYAFRTGLPTERRVAIVFKDIGESKEAEERQALLMAELNHRVKNTLALVQSIANQTLRSTPDPARFAENFQERLQALSRTHNLLVRYSWDSAEVAEIVRDQVRVDDQEGNISATGPFALLASQTVVALSLVLHELATNARKYGSLSVPEGRLLIRWEVQQAERRLHMSWAEEGGPAVQPPARRGFGTTLIERSLSGVGGGAETRFEPTGLRCTIQVPLAAN